MMLTSVTLQNYGIYGGSNEFNLSSDDKKPVVLMGGTNGAGKTTLFESIMLCFYGMSVMGKRATKKEYRRLLFQRVHRYPDRQTQADHTSIAVQFVFFHNGREKEYRVERSWRVEDGELDEKLDVGRRDLGTDRFVSLDTVEKSHWQSFINDIIPRGIMRLFFLDGEKIAEMAKGGSEDAAIRESFMSLLGLDLVEQLQADLQVNLARNLKGSDMALREDFERSSAEKGENAQVAERLQRRLAEKQNALDLIHTQIDSLEARISSIGSGFANGRAEAKVRLAEQQAAYESAQQRLVDLCSGVLPFSLIPEQLKSLSELLETDKIAQETAIRMKGMERVLHEAKAWIASKPSQFWTERGIYHTVDPEIIYRVLVTVERETAVSAPPDLVFGFSTAQTTRIQDVIKQANTSALGGLSRYAAKLAEADTTVTKLETSIARAPSDDEMGPLVTKIGKLHSEEGTLRAEMDHLDEKLAVKASLKASLDSKLRDIMSEIYKNEKSGQRVRLTRDVQTVLDEFVAKLRVRKVSLLEQHLLESLGVLMHKKDFIDKVKIDPDSFDVQLFDSNEVRIPKEDLSEGEKQMFTMAVLWALAKTSGRHLPFMIDTPLARLDSRHRRNVVDRFLPVASHQVLVFSTDEEIKHRDFQKLAPHMARSYVLESVDGGGTRWRDGYFWSKEGRKVAAV